VVGVENTASGKWSNTEGARNEASGDCSHAEGFYASASGTASHAEGWNTLAVGQAHAEGHNTTAFGSSSHAEGSYTFASGSSSHAEGRGGAIVVGVRGGGTTLTVQQEDRLPYLQVGQWVFVYRDAITVGTHSDYLPPHYGGDTNILTRTQITAIDGNVITLNDSIGTGIHNIIVLLSGALGENSHVEGKGTIAQGANQHAQGVYNIEDTEEKYAHIVGNGESATVRSNAHTVAWDGTGWFAGDVKVGGTSQDDTNAKKLATEEYVDTKVSDLVNAAPEALDTLKELSTALGDDPNFATTILNQLNNKVEKVEGKDLSTNDYTNEEKIKVSLAAAMYINNVEPVDAAIGSFWYDTNEE
jgi:hypothetical protein